MGNLTMTISIQVDKKDKELLEAIQEGEDIIAGKVKTKSYTNMYEMLEDLKK